MTDMLLVDFGAMQRASDDVQAALRTLETQLGDLERDAAPLVETWDGSAREAYEARQQKWRQAARDLAVMLRDIKSALDESCADYMSTEKKNASLFE